MPTPANTSVYSVRVLLDVGVVGVGGDSAVAGGERRTPKARGRSAGGDDGVQRVGAILVFLCLRGRPWGEWKDAQREKRKPPAARCEPRIPPAFIRHSTSIHRHLLRTRLDTSTRYYCHKSTVSSYGCTGIDPFIHINA